MLTPDQEQWIDSLSTERIIKIVPYDPKTDELFGKVKNKITDLLGPEVLVEHSGASSLGISGQDEIDVAIVADKEKFNEYIPKLETIFGEVRSRYEDRVRFEVKEDGKKIDLKIVDTSHPNYAEEKLFVNYLRNHPEDLGRYQILKEECNGLTVKEYYRRKVNFINEIQAKAKSE